MSLSITPQEYSISVRVLVFSKIMLNIVNAMLVWSSRPSPIMGYLVTGTIMEKSIKEYSNKTKKMKDNREDNQLERYGRSPQYGCQINVEEKVWITSLNHFQILPG